MTSRKQKVLKPYTAEDWTDRLTEIDHDSTILLGYMVAVERLIPELDTILKKAKTFEELKTEIFKINKQQKDFLKDVYKRWWENDDCENQYNLPRM